MNFGDCGGCEWLWRGDGCGGCGGCGDCDEEKYNFTFKLYISFLFGHRTTSASLPSYHFHVNTF